MKTLDFVLSKGFVEYKYPFSFESDADDYQWKLKWYKRFLSLAREISTWSKDPSTQCGAVIVDGDKSIISLGYNGFPRDMSDAEELYADRPTKLSRVVHAEMNAILNAKTSVRGAMCIMHPGMPCDRCTVHMIQAGIETVVFPDSDFVRPEFHDHSLQYLNEANIETFMVDIANDRLYTNRKYEYSPYLINGKVIN